MSFSFFGPVEFILPNARRVVNISVGQFGGKKFSVCLEIKCSRKTFVKALTFQRICGIIFERLLKPFNEVWLSLVERHVRDVEAVGSNPVTSTKSPLYSRRTVQGGFFDKIQGADTRRSLFARFTPGFSPFVFVDRQVYGITGFRQSEATGGLNLRFL